MSASDDDRLAALQIVLVRAQNPSALTLSGTNTWVVARDPAWVIDPGPSSPEHLVRIVDAVGARGGAGAVLLTHDHADHSESAAELARTLDAPLAGARGDVDLLVHDGDRVGPLEALATPGHATDHLAFVFGRACFTGDAVLGEGSVFIAPAPGAMAGYLRGLARLRERDLEVLCPGHGPPVWDPPAKLDAYVEHRLERERRLLGALDEGRRSVDELLDAAWSEVPPALRPVAAVTLTAHLDKLADEGRLPEGVQRPVGGF